MLDQKLFQANNFEQNVFSISNFRRRFSKIFDKVFSLFDKWRENSVRQNNKKIHNLGSPRIKMLACERGRCLSMWYKALNIIIYVRKST